MPTRLPPSLRARAIAFLARREHSRTELRRKLASARDPASLPDSEDELEALLDELEAAGLLSSARFADSVVNRRAARFGTARIRHELREHAVPDEITAPLLAELERTEYERARQVWERRFGTCAQDQAGRMRQARFLAARGFRADLVRRIVSGRDSPDPD